MTTKIDFTSQDPVGITDEYIIQNYLDKQISYARTKIEELRGIIKEYPEDEYSITDLKNCLYLLNVLHAMKRRIDYKN